MHACPYIRLVLDLGSYFPPVIVAGGINYYLVSQSLKRTCWVLVYVPAS